MRGLPNTSTHGPTARPCAAINNGVIDRSYLLEFVEIINEVYQDGQGSRKSAHQFLETYHGPLFGMFHCTSYKWSNLRVSNGRNNPPPPPLSPNLVTTQ